MTKNYDDHDADTPISQQIPRTDGMVTIAEGKTLRVPRWLKRVIVPESDEMKFVYILFFMFFLFGFWFAWDYSACHERNPDCTIVQCFGHLEPKPIKARK